MLLSSATAGGIGLEGGVSRISMTHRWNFTIVARNGNRRRLREFLNSKNDSVTVQYFERPWIGIGRLGIGHRKFMGHAIGDREALALFNQQIKDAFKLESDI